MPEPLACPFCGGPLAHSASGYSEYDHGCAACGAGFAIDEAAGTAQSRRWDRQAAKGLHQEFTLAELQSPPVADA